MLPFHLVYHEGYDLNLGSHVFPSQKFRMIRDRLLAEGFAAAEDFIAPGPAPDEDLLLVHERGWIERLKTGRLSYEEILQLEIPYSPEMARAFVLAAGGTTLAAHLALDDGIAYNVGGGFHHAFPDHGEGFCAINDIAVGIRKLQREGKITRAMVVDCDNHHGNGTAAIFAGDPTVFTLSIHQYNNYPARKPTSSVDIHLSDGVTDEEYIERLGAAYRFPLHGFHPELIVYVAGADPYCEDQLGGLSLTFEGLQRRDRLVIETALREGAAVAIVLAGGYAVRVEDTVTIHANTAKVAKEALEAVGWVKK
ncbi:MAG TPA: histone deacetylase [Bryobacteraceae bacterium]|jgi:acetoin utilization deacetylase AcuC-like enzyme|nr:histone deacetylase [Bryobacteraceae bacterium]